MKCTAKFPEAEVGLIYNAIAHLAWGPNAFIAEIMIHTGQPYSRVKNLTTTAMDLDLGIWPIATFPDEWNIPLSDHILPKIRGMIRKDHKRLIPYSESCQEEDLKKASLAAPRSMLLRCRTCNASWKKDWPLLVPVL